MVRWTIIAVLAAVNLLAGTPGFLSEPDGYLLRACSYPLFHAGWWHLAVNCLAVWTVYDGRRRKLGFWTDFAVPYLISVIVYPLSFRPVIGFSNMLYALLGLRTPPLSSPWWKRTEVAVFIVVTLGMVFIPRFSATTHVAAFVLGMAAAALRRGWNRLTEDARRNY